ncbi:MAG: HD-GYP domain-containing protein [Planctomycetes bacterium]|nr:HD-GYP domain-containing protein [Planctomycetota bacterium]
MKDLISQLSAAVSGASDRTLGVVGPGVSPAHAPAYCLRTCLHDDPGQIQARGCPWLRAAAAGRLDAGCLQDGRCPSGFHVAGRSVRLDGDSAFLLAIEVEARDRAAGDRSGLVLDKLESLSQALEKVGQLVDENEGLAEEVLRGYEQLNLIFDFTQQIASFTDADEIERALLRRLGELLATQTVLVVGPNSTYRCYDVAGGKRISDGDASVLPEQLTIEIEAARASRAIVMHSCASSRIVIGPLMRLDGRIDMVLALRPLDADQFTSGDMLLTESLLTFGGQIISNAEVHERLRHMSLESTRALVAAIDKKDHYTSGHSERVGYLARLIGRRMRVPANELQVLEMSSLLHDVGKIGIPEGILCKPGKLTKEEYDIIKNHPRMGHEILTPIASFGGVLDGVLHHHENPDGSGYPEGLGGDEIPLFARIIHVVDVFDALTSTRSYRVAFSPEQACDILRKEAGTKLDAEVVAVFLDMVSAFQANPPDELADVFYTKREVTDVAF